MSTLPSAELQTAVDAATLAAAQNMPDPVNAQTAANMYSMAPAGTAGVRRCPATCFNANPRTATATVPIVKTLCITAIPGSSRTPTGVPCQVYRPAPRTHRATLQRARSGHRRSTGCNAVQVSRNEQGEHAVPRTSSALGSMFGTVTSKSTVLMRGGTPHPLDVEIVLDVSWSMTDLVLTRAAGPTPSPECRPASRRSSTARRKGSGR